MRKHFAILRYALKQWPRLLVILALNAITAGIAAFQPWPMKLLVDYALRPDPGARLSPLVDWLVPATTAGGFVTVAAVATLVLFVANSSVSAALAWTWANAGRR
ncbi:MAG: ABC transporter ATP-binding protein, partial [Gemmatimonadaceae bacterium]|nr:ABC transporter ATP-binding protein [Gemmatimonadaceae bacterium]